IGKLEIVSSQDRKLFELTHGVVGEKTHCTGSERGHSGDTGRTMFAQKPIEYAKDAAFDLFFAAFAFQRDLVALRAQDHIRTRSQEGVAPDLLSALHRLQQK